MGNVDWDTLVQDADGSGGGSGPIVQLPPFIVRAQSERSIQEFLDRFRLGTGQVGPMELAFLDGLGGSLADELARIKKQMECDALRGRHEQASKIQERYANQFKSGAPLSAFAGVQTIEDALGVANQLSDSMFDLVTAGVNTVGGSLPVGQGIASIDLNSSTASSLAKGVLVGFDLAVDGKQLGAAIADGDITQSANGVVSIGATLYAIGAVTAVSTGVGPAIGIGKLVINGSLWLYKRSEDASLKQGFAEAVTQSVAAYTKSAQSARSLEAEITQKGCQ